MYLIILEISLKKIKETQTNKNLNKIGSMIISMISRNIYEWDGLHRVHEGQSEQRNNILHGFLKVIIASCRICDVRFKELKYFIKFH